GRSEIPRRFVVLVAIVTVVVTKTAFGRYDSNHFSVLLGLIVVTVAITPLLGILRRGIEIALAVLFVVYLAGILVVEQRPVAVLQAPVRAVDRVLTLGWPDLATRHIEQSKARQRAHYGVPDRFIKAIGSGTVHVDPDETSVVWAYGLAWRPAPVFQTYSVYTPTLDKLNGDTLASGPQFVLSRRSPTSPATGINDRLGVQENPLYSLALLCNYTRTDAENGWILFSRNGSHCGPLAPLAEVTVHDGDVVNVPAPSAPGMAVLVGIGLKPTVLDRAFMGAVVPLTAFTVVLDGMSYRLISGNAAEPFLVASPASADGTNLEINARTIGIGRTRSLGQGGVAARLRFYEMRVQS
ncbi:MAG: hypothetical protein JO236_16115, partial [Mycobacterium sp.]|nr:hypothetical protein [Mycobacterium sp.]